MTAPLNFDPELQGPPRNVTYHSGRRAGQSVIRRVTLRNVAEFKHSIRIAITRFEWEEEEEEEEGAPESRDSRPLENGLDLADWARSATGEDEVKRRTRGSNV